MKSLFQIRFQFLILMIPAFVIGCSSSNQSKENSATSVTSGDWIELFDGTSLDGWTQKNGTATYEVSNGAIVGKTSKGSPNSFLCTDKSYQDFELEFEVKVDKGLNSGVQIRSKAREASIGDSNNEKAGRVIGPQVEIVEGDSSSLSGYIWREATGDGWMISKGDPVGHTHFNGGEWNKYRILANGPRIRTWINGNLVEDVTDEKTQKAFPEGFIGLQVHGIKEGSGPYQVAWKNIKIRVL